VDVSQRLPFFGKRALRGERALAEADALGADLASARVRLAALASARFDDYWLATRALAVNAEHVRLVEALQRSATARYAAGEAGALDALEAESELSELEHERVMLETERRIAAEELAALLHRDPTRPLPAPPDALVPPPPPVESDDALVARTLAERPELRAAAGRVRAAAAAVGLARREYWPDVTLVGAHDSLWQEEELQPFVGISFSVPLQRASRRAAVEEAEAELTRAEEETRALEDEVRAAVRSASARLAEQRHLATIFRDRRLPAARDRLVAARIGFETGQVEFSDVIAAARALRAAELGLEEAIANTSRRHAELERATGRVPGER
jgi:outer membrane protein TolC